MERCERGRDEREGGERGEIEERGRDEREGEMREKERKEMIETKDQREEMRTRDNTFHFGSRVVFLFVCLFVCLLACLFACVLLCLFACLLVCLFACLLVCLFACLFLCLSPTWRVSALGFFDPLSVFGLAWKLQPKRQNPNRISRTGRANISKQRGRAKNQNTSTRLVAQNPEPPSVPAMSKAP